jgi:hypothetical protein
VVDVEVEEAAVEVEEQEYEPRGTYTRGRQETYRPA